MVWRVLADECRLTANPWDRITHKLNALANRKRALTPGQFDALLASVEGDPDLHDLLTLLAWTGLRHATAAGMPAAMVKSITGHATDGMLEHYQHIGAGLASDLALRISANGATKAISPVLPPGGVVSPEDELPALKQAIRGLVEGMTAKTWKNARSELLSMLA